jgi:hypothetical protein
MACLRFELAGALVAALALAGCGVGDLHIDAPHDRLTVIVDGNRTTVAQSGSGSIQIDGVPEFNYSGPLGCKGRYFTDEDLYFRYSAKDAALLIGNQLYRFATGPRQVAGQMVWKRNFGPRRVEVLTNCPMPR